jgi:TPR repeat protein
MRPTVLFCAVLLAWFGIATDRTHALATQGALSSVDVAVAPYASPPSVAMRDFHKRLTSHIAQALKTPLYEPMERVWVVVQNTTDRAVREGFARRQGNLARDRLTNLTPNMPPADPAERAWAAVQNTTDRAALENFIQRFGDSIYAILGRGRLAKLTAGTPEQEITTVSECNRLAANPDDTSRQSGVAGTRWELLDPIQAVPACRSATAVRPDDPRLMYQLGRVLDKQRALTEALSWYQKAADSDYPEAMNNLGIMYTNGRGVERNDAEALRLFRKAVDRGSADAITNLGFMHHYGRGVAPDPKEAVRLFRKAADTGSAEGMYWLGLMHEIGAGVSKDDAEAFKWYRKAADKGVASAMNKLGVLYSTGIGVGKDVTQAIQWYRAAVAAGSADAKENLRRLGN